MEIRGRLHEMGEKISDERFEDILLRGLTDDYELVKCDKLPQPKLWHCRDSTNDEKLVHRPTLETRTCNQASWQN